MLFFHVAFFIFWSQFEGVWGSKKGAKITFRAPKHEEASLFEVFETPRLSKMVSWKAPKSTFEPMGVDLEWFRPDFSKIWRRFWACFLTFSHEFPISTSSQTIVVHIVIFLTSGPVQTKLENWTIKLWLSSWWQGVNRFEALSNVTIYCSPQIADWPRQDREA